TQHGFDIDLTKTVDDKKSFDDLTSGYNVVIRSNNKLSDMMLKLNRISQGDNKPEDNSILVGWEGDIINELMSVKDVTIYATDNYGHEDTFSPKSNILLFVSNENLEKEFNPNNESIMTFEQFRSGN